MSGYYVLQAELLSFKNSGKSVCIVARVNYSGLACLFIGYDIGEVVAVLLNLSEVNYLTRNTSEI